MATETNGAPAPGSDAAVSAGCRCPVWDNAYGRGWMGGPIREDGEPIYIVSGACPLHGLPATPAPEESR